MNGFDPSTTMLAGVSREVLLQWLTEAQTAYQALMTGSKGESYSYTQGDGTKSITYTRASLPQLAGYITQLQMQLGMRGGRRSMRMRYC